MQYLEAAARARPYKQQYAQTCQNFAKNELNTEHKGPKLPASFLDATVKLYNFIINLVANSTLFI